MQSPHNTPGSYSNQHPQQSSLSSRDFSSNVGHSNQAVGYHPVGQSAQTQVQSSTHGHTQGPHHPAMVSGNPAALPSVSFAQQPLARSSVNPQYPSQRFASDAHHAAGVYVNPGIPAHFQNYRPIEHGQPVVPSQSHAHSVTPQDSYHNPATWTQDTHSHYSNLATSSSSPTMSGYPAPLPSALSSPHICDVCGATFTRPQNLKRHRESQHTTMEHICPYCGKSYTRVDSLKRHMDKPCDKLPPSAQQGA